MAGREARKRRRRRRKPPGAPTPSPASSTRAAGRAPEPAGPAKSKDDLAREQLVPLHEGERPLAVTIGALLAALLAVANVVGVAVAGSEAGGALPFAVLMAVAALGMWRARYWAVLGFEVILALVAVSSLLFLLLRAGTALEVLLGLITFGIAGTLFWFLVKSLARLQLPVRSAPPRG